MKKKTLKATFQEGMEEGRAEEKEEGLVEGRKLARMVQILMASGQSNEADRVLNDETERQMLKQYANRLN